MQKENRISFKITGLGKCQKSQFYANENRKRNCDAAFTEHTKRGLFLQKTQNGENTLDRHQLDLNITSIR